MKRTAETITDEEILEAIAELDSDLCSLQAALKIKRGPMVPMLRERAAEILNAKPTVTDEEIRKFLISAVRTGGSAIAEAARISNLHVALCNLALGVSNDGVPSKYIARAARAYMAELLNSRAEAKS